MSHLSPNALAAMAGLSARQVQRCLKKGEIFSARRTSGGHWRIPEAEGRAWAEAARRMPPTAVQAPPSPTPATAREFIALLPTEVARLPSEIGRLYGLLWQAGAVFVDEKGPMKQDEWQTLIESTGLDYWPVYRAMRLHRRNPKRPPQGEPVGQFRELVNAAGLPLRKATPRKRSRGKVVTPFAIIQDVRKAIASLPVEEREEFGAVLRAGLFGV